MKGEERCMAYEDSGEEYQLGKSLSNLPESGDLCGIPIIVSDGHVQAHKVILCARSSFFKAMLCRNFTESDKSEFHLGADTFTKFGAAKCVTYLFTGVMEIPEDLDCEKIEKILQGELKVFSYNVGITFLTFKFQPQISCVLQISLNGS